MTDPSKVLGFPWQRVPRWSRRDAAVQSMFARWLAVCDGRMMRLERLLGGPVRAELGGALLDAHAAACELRLGGASIIARGSSGGVRAIARHLLGGPEEAPAPRPLTLAEQAIWSLVVATAVEDLGIAAEVWPRLDSVAGPAPLAVTLTLGSLIVSIESHDLDLRAPPPQTAPWTSRVALDGQLILGRCALFMGDLARLAPRSLVTLEAPPTGLDLEILGGALGLRALPRVVVAEVATGYVRRPMALPDDASVELTVALGTTELTLRQVVDLAVGQIVTLGRPLGGPFEVRAAGKLVGKGELVDVDGELAVRIVSLGEQE